MLTRHDLHRLCMEVVAVAGAHDSFNEQWRAFGVDPDDAAFVLASIADYPGDLLKDELEQKISLAFSLGLKIGREQRDAGHRQG